MRRARRSRAEPAGPPPPPPQRRAIALPVTAPFLEGLPYSEGNKMDAGGAEVGSGEGGSRDGGLKSPSAADPEDSFGASELARALEDGQLSSSGSEGGSRCGADDETVMRLVGEGLTNVPANLAAGLPALRRLCLHGNAIAAVSGLSGLSALRDLDLSSNCIAELPPGALSGLGRLTALDLAGNRLTRLVPALLAGLPSLRRLSLAGNGLAFLEALAALHGGPLQRLDLRGNALASLAEFSVLAGLPRLEELLVAGGEPGTWGVSPVPGCLLQRAGCRWSGDAC